MFFIVQIKPLKFDFSVLYYPSIDIKSVFFYTYPVDITIIYKYFTRRQVWLVQVKTHELLLQLKNLIVLAAETSY